MNGDVARLIMDPDTTQALGGIVVIDHYVATPELTAQGLKDIAQSSGGKVVLGEFGAPIPDIQGSMTESEQATWIAKTYMLISQMPEVVGVNYWANLGSSTALWNTPGSPRSAVGVVSSYYKPNIFMGSVVDETGSPIKDITVSAKGATVNTDNSGNFEVLYTGSPVPVNLKSPGFNGAIVIPTATNQKGRIALVKQNPGQLYSFIKSVRSFLHL